MTSYNYVREDVASFYAETTYLFWMLELNFLSSSKFSGIIVDLRKIKMQLTADGSLILSDGFIKRQTNHLKRRQFKNMHIEIPENTTKLGLAYQM